MKFSVVLFVVLVASVCADDGKEAHKKKIMEMKKKCFKESGTTPEEWQACRSEKKECPKVDCFNACSMRERRLINNDGTVNTKVIEQYASQLAARGHPKSSAVMKKCFQNPEQKTSFCDSARLIYACMDKEPQD